MRAASLLPAIALIAACGNVKIVDNPVASTDVTSTDASDAGTMDVGGGKADTAGFDPQLACANIFDCQDKNLLNSSPCKEKKCVSVETGKICDGTGKCLGQCQYVLKPVGVTCADPVNPAGECETTTCDDAGVCQHASKKDGTTCGMTKCGNLCKAGACIAATGADYDDGNQIGRAHV